MKTRIILVGGFLGAGKTTLLWKAAKRLIEQGKKVALITNDQAPELVDSVMLKLLGLTTAEVSGSCFCCNFNGFIEAIEKMNGTVAPDVIIAEPVGSCADLSATIIQPLKKFHQAELDVAPFTVLADPIRLEPIIEGGTGGLHPDAAYIYRKQLEEGDIILITKADAAKEGQVATLEQRLSDNFPSTTVKPISALDEDGLDEWLNDVMTRNDAGKRLLDINYDIYAHGEAVLGWLNGTLLMHGDRTDWDVFTKNLLTAIGKAFDAKKAAIGHVKVITESGDKFIIGNFAGGGHSIRNSAGIGDTAKITINARVELPPEELDNIVRTEMSKLFDDKITYETLAWKYLQPGRPNPTHRFVEVVK